MMTTQQRTTTLNTTPAYPFVFGSGASQTSIMTNPTTISMYNMKDIEYSSN